jgi:hypothetical protein
MFSTTFTTIKNLITKSTATSATVTQSSLTRSASDSDVLNRNSKVTTPAEQNINTNSTNETMKKLENKIMQDNLLILALNNQLRESELQASALLQTLAEKEFKTQQYINSQRKDDLIVDYHYEGQNKKSHFTTDDMAKSSPLLMTGLENDFLKAERERLEYAQMKLEQQKNQLQQDKQILQNQATQLAQDKSKLESSKNEILTAVLKAQNQTDKIIEAAADNHKLKIALALLIIIGAGLCFTGVGAFLGVPLLVGITAKIAISLICVGGFLAGTGGFLAFYSERKKSKQLKSCVHDVSTTLNQALNSEHLQTPALSRRSSLVNQASMTANQLKSPAVQPVSNSVSSGHRLFTNTVQSNMGTGNAAAAPNKLKAPTARTR